MEESMFQEYPKWIYPAGIKDTYDAGEAPFIVQDSDEESALTAAEKPRRGRPPKAPEAE